MTSKAIKTTAVLAIIVIASYWYWSPFLAVQQMRSAAEKQDADSFNERVDYPKLRESLKGQFSALLGEQMAKTQESGNPFAALGAMLGGAMVNQFVDAMVTPEAVMRAMQNGKMSPKPKSSEVTPSAEPTASAPQPEPSASKPKWTYDRKGVDKLIAYATDPEKPLAPNAEKLGVVFERNGFANWKLTEVRLPTMNK